jgi:hypothetical protein
LVMTPSRDGPAKKNGSPGFSHGPGTPLFWGGGTPGRSPQHTTISGSGLPPHDDFLARGWVALQDCHRSTPRFPGSGVPTTAGQDDFLPPHLPPGHPQPKHRFFPRSGREI